VARRPPHKSALTNVDKPLAALDVVLHRRRGCSLLAICMRVRCGLPWSLRVVCGTFSVQLQRSGSDVKLFCLTYVEQWRRTRGGQADGTARRAAARGPWCFFDEINACAHLNTRRPSNAARLARFTTAWCWWRRQPVQGHAKRAGRQVSCSAVVSI
jgi:hypothetical protein